MMNRFFAVIRRAALFLSLFLLLSCGGSNGNDDDDSGAPSGDMQFGNLFFASSITDDGDPINVNTVFTPTNTFVYSFATWSNVPANASCESVWYQDGEEISRDLFLWELGSRGTDWIANINFASGFPRANFRWELYVQGELVISGSFSVQ